MAYMFMAPMVMAYMVLAYAVMGYIIMAYVDMAYIVLASLQAIRQVHADALSSKKHAVLPPNPRVVCLRLLFYIDRPFPWAAGHMLQATATGRRPIGYRPQAHGLQAAGP